MKAVLKIIQFLCFVVLAAGLSHWFFSWIGFNPTDEGFVLAGARRILEGQIPHVDFITLRPAGSNYLHALLLQHGGDQVFWWSRAVFWVQSAIIAWTWVAIADKTLRLGINILNRSMLAVIVFLFNTHYFPPMAWTTVDGLFFASLGLWLLTHFSKNGNQLGYILLGCAALCKQNFLILIPGVFVIMGHFRRPYYLLDGVTPAILYGLLIWRHSGLDAMYEQLFARHELVATGLIAYVTAPGFYIGLALPLCIDAFRKRYKGFLKNIDFILAFDLVLLGAATLAMNLFIGDFSFALFGFTIGYAIVHMKRKGYLLFSALCLLTAWTVSISLGYNTPALAGGILMCALLTTNYDGELFSLARKVKYPIAAFVLALTIGTWSYARLHYVYKDAPARELTAELGNVLKGGNGIRTNAGLAASIAELDSLQTRYGDSLTVVPDYTAFRVTSAFIDPLPIDWPNAGEMSSEEVRDRVEQFFVHEQGNLVVALQKYRVSELYEGEHALEDEKLKFPVVEIVENHYLRMGETKYFYLYR